jgi:hypothetical protein
MNAAILGYLHGPELRRVGRTAPPGHHDRRHERRHIADHPHGYQVCDVDGRPELLQLHRADERQDQAEQERDERYDAERIGSGLLNQETQIRPAVAGPSAQEPAERLRGLAQEPHFGHGRVPHSEPEAAGHGQPWFPLRCDPGAPALWHGARQVHQAPHAVGKARPLDRNTPLVRRILHPLKKGEDAAVPTPESPRVISHARRRW